MDNSYDSPSFAVVVPPVEGLVDLSTTKDLTLFNFFFAFVSLFYGNNKSRISINSKISN